MEQVSTVQTTQLTLAEKAKYVAGMVMLGYGMVEMVKHQPALAVGAAFLGVVCKAVREQIERENETYNIGPGNNRNSQGHKHPDEV